MRRYVDFWVIGEERERAVELLRALARLGYSDAVMELKGDLAWSFEELRDAAAETGVRLHRKLVLKPNSRKELLQELRRSRGKFEVITVICENLEVALVAARDSRVDSLIIPPKSGFRIDKGVASTIRNCVELPFSWYLANRQLFLEAALRIIQILGRRVGVIVSSASSSALLLRGPIELASLPWVLGYPQERALDTVSKTPSQIIERNLLKLSSNYVCRGVVKIGKEDEEEVPADIL
ncbi:MAG: RNase P subunit p30 family protein [Nitrososphaerota archaeon]